MHATPTCRDLRLIPAHAGKTRRTPVPCKNSAAHPRSRGENFVAAIDILMGAGSSPLTRGKRGVLLRALSGPGLIPAHAGKTYPASSALVASGAHPRSRGENAS